MKKIYFCFVFIGLLFCLSTTAIAQGVGINPSGNPPDPSAGLDVNFTNKGTLITRMTTVQRDSIVSPAEGLQIFNTTSKCLQAYVYGVWQSIWCATCPAPPTPVAGSHTPSPSQITWNWNSVSGATGYKWSLTNSYLTATDNGPSTSYIQAGLSICTSYTVYVWAYNSCNGVSLPATFTASTTGSVPAAPTAGTSTTTLSQIAWNWNPVSGASGYKWNTSNDSTTATNNGTSTTYTQTGLSSGTTYNLYVWAYNSCGLSSTYVVLTATTATPTVVQFTSLGGTNWTAPAGVTSVEVLVVGGGGGGGESNGGGGGGAGGVVYNPSYPVIPGNNYTVIVGAGGTSNSNGQNSSFDGEVALGGGRGGTSGQAGFPGGSGGGAGRDASGAPGGSAQQTGGGGWLGYGNNGGGCSNNGAAGGGGAGGAGFNSTGDGPPNSPSPPTGDGGIGKQFSITGTPVYYAGGGGGSVYNSTYYQVGGAGGGGQGCNNTSISATSGQANTGGGGGGGSTAGWGTAAGSGGSGIVILRY